MNDVSQQERKSAVAITFPPVAPGCAPTVRLTVTVDRKTMPPRVLDSCEYSIEEIPALPGDRRAFRLRRLDIERSPTWDVRVARNWIGCDCEAGTLCKVRCKHVLCIEELLKQERYDPNNEKVSA